MKDFLTKKGSMTIFYFTFFIGGLINIIFKSDFISILVQLILIILFIARIIWRRKELNSLQYYLIHEEKQINDSKMRANQLGDCVAILIYFYFVILMIPGLEKQFGNSIFGVIWIVALIYFALASCAIIKNSTFLMMLTGLLSTIQGLLIILIMLGIVLMGCSGLFSGYGFEVPESILKIFNYDFIIILAYYIESDITIVIGMMICSVLLYITLIITAPAYQLDKLSFAFKMVNIVVVLGGIVVFFFSANYILGIQEFIRKIMSTPEQYNNLFSGVPEEFIKYLNNFGKSNLTNMGYILFLPYTIGVLIANLVIEHLKKIHTAKAKRALDELITELNNNGNEESIDYLEKKYHYYGGDKYIIKLINNRGVLY